ncbi:Peptidoglycan L-alanyl-D-glutamate endopeptidase CwlK precursor [compost metagenome]
MALTLDQVKAKSASKLTGLHPVMRQATERLIERSFARGVPILITQGLRTIAEQDALYAQGRNKPGQIVTKAKGGYSNHNFGVAIDFALLQPDGKSVSWTVGKEWMVVVEIAKSLGFEWGGDWRSFKDMPHFEMCFGLTTAQYRAGRKPSGIALAKAISVINKEDDVMKEELAKLTKRVGELEAAAKRIPAPKWFVAEFGSGDLGGVISEPAFTVEGWRTLAVGLRVSK